MKFSGIKMLIPMLGILLFVSLLSAQEKPNPWAFEPDSNLPNVLILGDSISEGYTLPVRKLLTGKANVYRPMNAQGTGPENCGNTKMGLQNLDRWLDTKKNGGKKWDVIHFNWGLWDINRRIPHNQNNTGVRDKVNGVISFTEKEYAENLEKIIEKLEATGAKLIWGSTSFVPEGEEGRVQGDEIKYNAVAAEVMEKHHIPVDDIHRLTSQFEPAMFQKPGDVHYKGTGSQKIAEQVYSNILPLIPAQAQNTDTPSFDFQTGDGKTITVYYLLPPEINQKTKVLFVMNGTDRDAPGNVKRFSEVPGTLNAVVLIPLLTRKDYKESQYQYGNIGGKTEYSEWTFNVIDSIFIEFRKKQNLQAETYILFGHSAGGQFSIRTALFSKSPYIGLVVAANPGSHTFLNEELDYPHGIKDMLKYKDTILANLSNRQVYLLAGSTDTNQDDPNLSKKFNEQGLHRFERSINFDQATRDYAEKNGVKYDWKLIKMGGVGHSSSQTLPHLIKIISSQEK